MQDLIQSVAEKAGISETQAKMAVGAVVDRFDDKLPGPVAAQVKKALGIDTAGMLEGVAGDVMGNAGGMADKAKEMLGDQQDAAGDVGGALKSMLGN